MPLVRARCAATLLGVAAALSANGCTNSRDIPLATPSRLVSPYGGTGDVVWVVAPLINESGTSLLNELEVTDALVDQIRQIKGITALPTNRSIAAMRALEMPAVRSPDDALALAAATGADAALVGTITSWDPYDPPTIGLTIALFPRTPRMNGAPMPSTTVDPVTLRTATRESSVPATGAPSTPVASIADQADASNHAVLAEVQAYAVGRSDPRSAMGWQVYFKSMKRYTEFVCYRVLQRLLAQEQARLAPPVEHDKSQKK